MIVEARRGQWGGDAVRVKPHCRGEEEQAGVKWGEEEEELVMDSEVRLETETPTSETPSHKAQSTWQIKPKIFPKLPSSILISEIFEEK